MKRLIYVILISLGCVTSSWAGGWGYGGHGGHHYGGGYYYGGDYALALITGMVFGGLLTHFSYSRQQRYQTPQTTVVTSRSNRVVSQAQPRRTVQREFSGCIMTREYTTIIKIDGKEREAYGTRCMKADGSWVLGLAKLVPEFK